MTAFTLHFGAVASVPKMHFYRQQSEEWWRKNSLHIALIAQILSTDIFQEFWIVTVKQQ